MGSAYAPTLICWPPRYRYSFVCMRCTCVLWHADQLASEVLCFAQAAIACFLGSPRALSKFCRIHALRSRGVVCRATRSPSFVVCMRCASVLFCVGPREPQVSQCACAVPACCCLPACWLSSVALLHDVRVRIVVCRPTRS